MKGAVEVIRFGTEERRFPTVLDQYNAEIELIRKYFQKNLLIVNQLRQAQLTLLPKDVKMALLSLWRSEEFRKTSQAAVCSGKAEVINSFLVLMNRLENDETFRNAFGSSSYIPNNQECLLSNGPKYDQTQKCYYQADKNKYVKGGNYGQEASFFARPDSRPTVLRSPLKHPNITFTKGDRFWRVIFEEPRKITGVVREKDCIVFTVDISGFDTYSGPAIGDQSQSRMSVLRKSILEFSLAVRLGHVTALVLTHVDMFRTKYADRGIHLNILGEFPGAPVIGDEDDGSINLALGYFQKLFAKEREKSLSSMEGTIGVERLKELFRVFIVNGNDVENVQGTLRALLEQYFGLNVPIKESEK